MSKTIYFKNFIATALIVLLSYLIMGGTFSFWSYRSMLLDKRESMLAAARETRWYLEETAFLYGGLTNLDIRRAMSMISRASGFDMAIADKNGTIISCSDSEYVCEHIGKSLPADMLSKLTVSGSWSGTGDLDGVYSQGRYVVASIVTVGGADRYGFLLTSVDASVMTDMWRRFSGIFVLIALSVMCLTFLISLLTTRRQAEALSEMARAARRFARGDFSVRVGDPFAPRDDEIGELAHAFNAMADSLERSDTQRRELLANVSHELKTPMTVIAGFADGILDGTIPEENAPRYLATISSETKRLSRLVRSLLDASRSDEPAAPHAPFDAGEVIIQTLLGLTPKLEAKNMDCEPTLPEEPVFAVGDKDSITQVVYNLIDNAVKFASAGSTLRLSLYKQGERAFVSVEDEGETIPEAEMPFIFDRFHKADKSRGLSRDGVGLGLYIVKTILDHHGQQIFVESADGLTRFTFTLKLAPQPRKPVAPMAT